MRILRSILGVLLAVMLSQRYKGNELDPSPAWAASRAHQSLTSDIKIIKIHCGIWVAKLYQVSPQPFFIPDIVLERNGEIQDFRKCGDKLCGGWLGGQFYSTLSFLIGSCRSQTLHFMRAREDTPLHNEPQGWKNKYLLKYTV